MLTTSTLYHVTGCGQSKAEHVSRPDKSFILNNGFNCRLVTRVNHDGQSHVLQFPNTTLSNTIKQLCTFRVQENSTYSGMQWMVNSTTHSQYSQNEVLASQHQCPADLSLAEYKEFGSLRAGHRLQYRNLFRALSLQTLSFREKSVLALVCQTIWQAGPPAEEDEDGEPFWRDSHEDIAIDPHFTKELLSVLEQFLEKNRKNWNDELILLIVVLLCNRILSVKTTGVQTNTEEVDESLQQLFEGLGERAAKLLVECRAVALEWMTAIDSRLARATTTSVEDDTDGQQQYSSDERALRLKLVQIAAFGALTFAQGPSNSILLKSTTRVEVALGGAEMSSLSMWLYFITSINDNILLNNLKYQSLEPFTRNLLRWVRTVAVDLESHFHQQTASDKSRVLSQFAAVKWSGAPPQFAIEGSWENSTATATDQWYTSECYDQDECVSILQMDVVLGKFLVDGKPIGRLPFNITEHPDFQRLFGNLTLVVQTSGGSVAGGGKHITKDMYHGCKYKFQLRSSNRNGNQAEQQLIVTEILCDQDENSVEYELVSHKTLRGDVPKLLVDNFSHWNCKQTLQFRPRDFESPQFRTNVSFELDLKTRKLIEIKTGRELLDINSKVYKDICEVMCRLEAREFIHVFKEDSNLLSIELPRMNLNFFVSTNTDRVIFSKEHQGYKVHPEQGIESLVGLQRSLLLTRDNSNSLVLVPHGNPKAAMGYRHKDGHHTVQIDTETLRKPPCFVFQVDKILQRITAQPVQSAWLYLAHLHSLTSGLLPDPLTGLTGTESAISLFQSPLCWSCEPLDKESLLTLQNIGSLSPIRRYRPEGRQEMESVTFPDVIPSVCASEAYDFLVEKLLADSRRTAFAYETNPSSPSPSPSPSTNGQLEKRAYWRSQFMYAPQAQISPDFDPQFGNNDKPKCAPVSSLALDSNPYHLVPTHTYTDANLRAVRLLADCGHNWKAPSSPKVNPALLIQHMSDAPTISAAPSATEAHSQYLTGYPAWIQLHVIQDWIGLYNFARVVQAQVLQPVWTLMLGAMAFSEDAKTCSDVVEQLKILHSVAVHPDLFLELNPPHLDAGAYVDTKETTFNRGVIEAILAQFMKPVPSCTRKPSENLTAYQKRQQAIEDEHKRTFKVQKTALLNYLESTHGGLSKNVFDCQIQSVGGQNSHFRDIDQANETIKQRLVQWYWNKELRAFIEKVADKLSSIPSQTTTATETEAPWPELGTTVDRLRLTEFANRSSYNVGQIWMTKLSRRVTELIGGSELQSTPNLKPYLAELRRLIKPIRRRPVNSSSSSLNNSSHIVVVNGSNSSEGEEYPLEMKPAGQQVVNSGTHKILEEYHKDLKASWKQHIQQEREKTKSQRQLQLEDNEDKDEIGLQFELNVEEAQKVRYQIGAMGAEYWHEIVQLIQKEDQLKCLRVAGILYRITPTTILPWLCDRDPGQFPPSLVAHIERVALCCTYEQKVSRCLRYAAAGSSMEPKLSRELDTLGYSNWTPDRHPEWVLLQLELDLMIRAVQVDVAERMGKAEGPHSLLQLNMGEGKTSVIIPMLAAALADGSTQLCRVTVLSSLYKTNRETLTFSMGGLLGQRIYTFPCRRELEFTVENLKSIQALYEECLARKGVVVTVPEFRLSFQLKLYEMCGGSSHTTLDTARQLWSIHNWLQSNVRDVLDECDELLNAKYQLVYTIGKEQQVSGGEERYIVTQKVLKLLPDALAAIQANEENPNEKVILAGRERTDDDHSHTFPQCRILDSSCYNQLCQLIANKILDGRSEISLPQTPAAADAQRVRQLLFLLMTEPALTKKDHEEAIQLLDSAKPNVLNVGGHSSSLNSFLNEKHVAVILILRALLAYGVLLHCLSRRWRVNYGVSGSGSRRNRMAVPFRAKDVASERTEFGHIDVAICFTQLSYYYAGLNEEQVRQCFGYLGKETNGELVYQSWIQGTTPPNTLSTLAGINLADTDETRNVTVPTLRKNVRVIDYWLSKAVYPRESKQFQYKLSCTPWDLCPEAEAGAETKHPVTGFSGTNDTKLILPLTVVADELPKLMGTNGHVLHNVLLAENDDYTALKHEYGAQGFSVNLLQILVHRKIPLLIDVGALIIDLDNESLAREWLKLADGSYKAAVYFNAANEIAVVDTRGNSSPLKLSPYAANLDGCLIYLDDHHTRGTDLRIPRGTRGAVTLGKGVMKDKLVQGCMRMRLLGMGHTLAFYASHEVDAEIRNMFPGAHIGVRHVLLWALNNSSVVTRDGFQHWTLAAANYYIKTGAHSLVKETQTSSSDGRPSDKSLQQLAELCQEKEELDIYKLYSRFRKEVASHNFVELRLTRRSSEFEELLRELLAPDPDEDLVSRIMDPFEDGRKKVVKRCRKYTSKVKKFSTLLDEEQERELENELEEIRQRQRPGQVQPVRSEFSPELTDFIQGRGLLDTVSSTERPPWFVPALHALKNTKMWVMIQEGSWGTNMYATQDFCKVVNRGEQVDQAGVDEYLRPVNWIISKTVTSPTDSHATKTHLLLISPFEANCVKPLFTSLSTASESELSDDGGGTYLHMVASRMHPDHSTFWLVPSLTLTTVPSNSQLGGQDSKVLNANLLVFSGSLYFKDVEEQSYYCHLLGLMPEPRTAAEGKLHAGGHIVNGWLSHVYRNRTQPTAVAPLHPAVAYCKFMENPVQLVDSILQSRHGGVAPQCSHAYKILHELKKPILEANRATEPQPMDLSETQ